MVVETKQVTIVNHPLVQAHLAKIRDVNTQSPQFRMHCLELGRFLIYEALAGLTTREIKIETPVGKAKGIVLTDYIILAPVLRAGLVLAEEAQKILPQAKVYHVGLKRNEKTLEAVSYYSNLPQIAPIDCRVFILDPMLATGGSALAACELFYNLKVKEINLISIVCAPEGIAKIHAKFPQIKIVTASVDKCLNDVGYIVPGLGDCGDRLFAT